MVEEGICNNMVEEEMVKVVVETCSSKVAAEMAKEVVETGNN